MDRDVRVAAGESMFRKQLRWYRQINYYSANRNESGWGRIQGGWLGLSLLIAIVVSLVFTFTVSRSSTLSVIKGRLHEVDGRLKAFKVDPQDENSPWNVILPIGQFNVARAQQVGGWPMIVVTTTSPAAIEVLRLRDDPAAGWQPALQDEIDAVDALLAEPGFGQVRDQVRSDVGGGFSIMAFLANIMVGWLSLWITGAVLILLAQVFSAWWRYRARRRQWKLTGKGLCPGCGYDVSANPFGARCPECGKLLS